MRANFPPFTKPTGAYNSANIRDSEIPVATEPQPELSNHAKRMYEQNIADAVDQDRKRDQQWTKARNFDNQTRKTDGDQN